MTIKEQLDAANVGDEVVAVKAFRNAGEKAPITVQFAQRVKRASSATLSFRLGATGNQAGFETSNTALLNLTENQFENLFGVKTPKGTKIVDLLDQDITADKLFELMFKTEAPSPARIRVIESTDPEVWANEEGEPKPGWSAKQAGADGVMLTNNGKQIYRSTEINFEGADDVLVAHEQIVSGSTVAAAMNAIAGKGK